MPASTANPSQAVIRRELHFFTLYRVLEAALLCLTVFSPVGVLLGGTPRHPLLAMIVAVAYLMLACGLFFLRRHGKVQAMALLGIGVDIAASLLAMHALPSAGSGIAMMLLFNVGAAVASVRRPSPLLPNCSIAASLARRISPLPSTSSTPVRMRRMISSLTSAMLATWLPRSSASAWLARICRPTTLVRVAMAR